MNGEIKRLIRKTKIAYQIQKTNSSEENKQGYRQLLQSKKGEIRRSKILYEIELAKSVKYTKTFKNILATTKPKKKYRSIA